MSMPPSWDHSDCELWDTRRVAPKSRRFARLIVVSVSPVTKTQLATALGHVAIRRRMTVPCARADNLFARLRADRLDNSVEAEMRHIATVDLLIIDDFILRPMDPTETNDF